jgi:hypothetical protein
MDDRPNGFIDKNSEKGALLVVLIDEQARKVQADVNAT